MTFPEQTRIALGEIHVREGFNVRTHLARIPELAAHIEKEGLIEPLVLRRTYIQRKHGTTGHYLEVVCGHRRRAALLLLMEEGRSIRGTKVTAQYPVACSLSDMTDPEARRKNMSENAHQEGLRRFDLLTRMAELARDDGVEMTALTLGKPESWVRRYLSLWERLSDKVKEEWAKITLVEHEPSVLLFGAISRGKDEAAQLRAWARFATDPTAFDNHGKEREGAGLGPRSAYSAAAFKRKNSRLIATKRKQLARKAVFQPGDASILLAKVAALDWVLGKLEDL